MASSGWGSMMRSNFRTVVAVTACVVAGIAAANAQGAVDLGSIWNEQEAGWQGVWTRVGRSNTFQAVWTKDNRIVRANLQMVVNGNTVSISRDDTFGPGVGKAGCEYTGTVKGNTISGDYNCAWSRSAGKWAATITR